MSVQSNNPSVTDPNASSELGKEDIIELLDKENEETLELPDKPTKPTKEKDEGTEKDKDVDTESEEDELKAIEEELEEPDEEKLELMTPVRRKEILKEYPDLFKKFPYLERAYYREQQFTEIFPTIGDARETLEKATAFDNFEKQVIKDGNIENVLKSVQTENKESFLRIVDDYLPALMRADENAYYHVLGNVIKDTIITMVRESKEMGDVGQPLLSAANILNQFVFGTNKFNAPTKLLNEDPNKTSREQELQQRERAIIQDQFESVRDDLQLKADNVLKATIDMHIDPKKSMTDYVRKNASREAFENLNSLIMKDARFRALLDKLWERAFEEKFRQPSKDRIKSAYLSKAKTLLPAVIKKARNDALRGLGKRVDDNEETDSTDNEKVDRKGPVTPGKSTSNSGGKIKSAKDIPVGMKSIDFLMQD